MPVSQPLGLGDKLREAISDAQRVLDSMDLRGKLKVDVVTGGVSGGVESSLDRTEKSAHEAAEKSILGPDAATSGPLGLQDKMVDALTRLIKTLEGLPSDLDKVGRGGRRPGKVRPAGEAPDEGEGAPGYVNPYMLQGLIQNPVGTTENSLMSMLMGGAGAGIKAPGWLMKTLAGSGGTFAPGVALASETGLTTAGAAGSYANPLLIGAAKVAVPVAAFAGTMAMQQAGAGDRLKDATDYVEDLRWSQNMGMNWREGTWANRFQSRSDIWQKDIRETFSSMNVGLGGLGGPNAGALEKVNIGQWMVNAALTSGLSSGQMGAAVGAGVRSGTVTNIGEGSGTSIVNLLNTIAEWTKKGKEYGFSSSESLQRIAEISQRGQMGAGLLTREAQIGLLSMEERTRMAMPESLRRTAPQEVAGALGGEAANETQRVMMMNQFLGSNGELNAEGEARSEQVFGKDQVAIMKKQYGRFAGTALAQQLTQTDLGRRVARVRSIQQLRRAGVSGTAIGLTMMGGDFLSDALGLEAAENPDILKEVHDLGRPGEGAFTMRGKGGLEETEELELARKGQVVSRLSGLTAESAQALTEFSRASTIAKRALVEFTDELRQFRFDDAWRTLKSGGTNR